MANKKTTAKLLGIAAIALAIVFSFAGCGNPAASDGNSSNNNSGSGGSTTISGGKLVISGEQVYTANYTGDDIIYIIPHFSDAFPEVAYTPITEGDVTLHVNISNASGGTADGEPIKIIGGKFSYTIETPSPSYLLSWDFLSGYLFSDLAYDGVTASDTSVKWFLLAFAYRSSTQNSHLYIGSALRKENESVKMGITSYTVTTEEVIYMYVNKDVTVTGKGSSYYEATSSWGCPRTYNTSDLNLALKNGWNAVNRKIVTIDTYSPDTYSPDTAPKITNREIAETITLNNSSSSALKWVFKVPSYVSTGGGTP
jgi:hypothetical protein